MSTSDSFEVHAYGCNIQLAATCPEAHSILERYAFPLFPENPAHSHANLRTNPGTSKPDQPDLFLRIVQVADQYQLLSDGAIVASALRPIALVPDLIRVLDDAILHHLATTTLRAVHAGAVLWQERILLLPGSSHAGKSSLVAEFLRRGATYFSDEYALIDPEGCVHPYPRPLLLRDGSPEQFPILAAEWHAPVGRAPAPVGWIFSLEYAPGTHWDIAPISQSEALLTLLRNTPHALADTPDLVDPFLRAVTGATCYAGRRPDAAEAANQILRLIDRPI